MVILTGVAFPAVIVTVASRVEAVLLGSTAMVNWPAVLSVTLHHVSSELALHEVWLVVTEINDLFSLVLIFLDHDIKSII